MNKKAASLILMLYELVVVIIVVSIVLTISTRLVKEETLKKINAAEDFAMMVNVLLGMPGDVIVEYPQNLSKFLLVLQSSNSIAIYEKDRSTDKDPVMRSFILPKGYAATGFSKQKARVCLKKIGKGLFLEECPAAP